jgi:hypothetical protein
MNETPQTYSGRRRLIEEILGPSFDLRAMVPTNTSSAFERELFPNSLMCSWADAETLTSRTLSVYVDAVPDGSLKAADVREMIAEEALVTPGQNPADAQAYEIPGPNVGEFVFVLNYLGDLTAISGNCVVRIMPSPHTVPLSDLAEPALEIARTVGCSPYVDDFEPPVLDTSKVTGAWTTADGWVYDPRTPPQP